MIASYQKYLSGFGLSFLISSLASAVLVILKEENAALLAWMKAFLGHHWVTHGVFAIVLFIVLGLVFSGLHLGKNWTEKHLVTFVLIGAVLSTLIVGVFFLLE